LRKNSKDDLSSDLSKLSVAEKKAEEPVKTETKTEEKPANP
jgi:hypothetical protein